jgi:uncharacterized protein YgbK (DUF1537 family)
MDLTMFIIADDFTGSGDSAVQFRTQERPARIPSDLQSENLLENFELAYVGEQRFQVSFRPRGL